MIWFTSDTHFGHTSAALKHRGFESVEAHDAALLERLNSHVGKNDVLYHLGDFGFGSIAQIEQFRSKIICQDIRLLVGNHDRRFLKPSGQKSRFEALFSSVREYAEIELDGHLVVLCHYPLWEWNRAHDGAWHLHGHVHADVAQGRFPAMLNVGVDNYDGYRPFEEREIAIYMRHVADERQWAIEQFESGIFI